jgi:hypothetical protein
MATRTVSHAQLGPNLADALDDYRLSLHAAGKSRLTQDVCLPALRYLDEFLAKHWMPRHLSTIRREHTEAGLANAMRDEPPATVSA